MKKVNYAEVTPQLQMKVGGRSYEHNAALQNPSIREEPILAALLLGRKLVGAFPGPDVVFTPAIINFLTSIKTFLQGDIGRLDPNVCEKYIRMLAKMGHCDIDNGEIIWT